MPEPPRFDVTSTPSRAGRYVAIVVAVLTVLGAAAAVTAWKLKPRATAPRPGSDHRALGETCKPSSRGDKKRNPNRGGCAGDAECKEGKNGRCVETLVGHARFDNVCVYDDCLVDADCRGKDFFGDSKAGPCICGEGGRPNVCAPGECSIDSDCGTGGRCSRSTDFQCGSEAGSGYYCHTKDDLCANDKDCADGGVVVGGGFVMRPECRYDRSKQRWACTSSACRVY